MKLKMYFLLLTMGAFTLTMQSCNDDEDSITVPTELVNALAEKHPSAQRIEWGTKGTFYVADFHEGNFEKEAWFTADATWQMTETDIPYQELPGSVKAAYEKSPYKLDTWIIDDVDMLERKDVSTVYVIEIEKKGQQDRDLYYSPEGILLKEVVDTDDDDRGSEDYLPSEIPSAIRDFISENYPDARIVEVEKEKNGMTEIEIIDKNIRKDVLLTADGQWHSTTWDISIAHLQNGAQKVIDAITQAYPGYAIDDVEFVETPANTKGYYLIEIEKGDHELKVKVSVEGEIMP